MAARILSALRLRKRLTTLRTGWAVARAIGSDLSARLRPAAAIPTVAPVVEPPRRLAHPATAMVQTAASPEKVFAILGDPKRIPDWLVIHSAWSGHPPAELAEGVAFGQRVVLMGVPSEVRWTVTRVDEPTVLWMEADGPMGTTVGCYLSIAAASSGTVVRIDGGVEGDVLKGPMGSVVARSLGEAMQQSLQKLAALAETGSGEAHSATAKPVPTVRQPRRAKPAPIRYQRTGVDIDAWTPVIVGVGQLVDRDNTTSTGKDPASLAAQALRLAAADAGVPSLLSDADSVRFVASVSWRYADGAAVIAEKVGAAPQETVQTTQFGGDGSQRLINDAAADIANGLVEIALLGGAESGGIVAAAEKRGDELPWSHGSGAPTRVLGNDTGPHNDAESAVGLIAPIFVYALLENAVRHRKGADPATHLAEITDVWSQFSHVAAANPYAWLPQTFSAEQLATAGEDNRPISAPYVKLLTANLQVNQASGLILCSAAAATEAGVPQDKWVFVHVSAHAEEQWYVSERADLGDSPAIRAMGSAALQHLGLTIDQIAHVDLYSCFPSAVQIAADALGLPIGNPDRPLTVTGGLTFAGGPGNNYTSHAVATLVPLLRAEPESYGLSTAVGWYLTKNALGIYSATPPAKPYKQIDAGMRMQRPTPRRVLIDYTGPAIVDSYTVPYRRDGQPQAAIISALTPAVREFSPSAVKIHAQGARILLRITDADLVDAIATGDLLGCRITVDGPNKITIDDDSFRLAVSRARRPK
ncbi:enoyl-CoA hydratase [Skermania sp. ID1734]|uniref:type II toxin-antitoxin system Rv0910 family toxin n=1 Tax=Skermania sp. ID1734 TaxID=2597516 RepID=UPI00117DB571|nr:SRPBCC family protein [Skermania sp. ID1734]TSD98078.1 enoyl-CoA hydratase [Skermania sp. ID1734]